ncbi:type II toxin-antitoxin system VapC family toxin [Mastigocladopsis repens]|uniref:type II toxin-antitoxin system VapC family toxin n=1 Tax=Mastigocladopsis repens TaxID=221287 RepID=UPI000313B955|nr:type II toxin-antitoxin system VapC family toxin [Mastigocladopsis repens]
MRTEVFLDTSYAIALSVKNDDFHEQAVRLADLLQAAGTRLVTTQAVLLEIGNALSRQRYRRAAVVLLNALETDSKVEIVSLSGQLYTQAFQLYCQRLDKEWGLVDCISFIVMQERGITEALTADEHFQQAGFRVLLRESLP